MRRISFGFYPVLTAVVGVAFSFLSGSNSAQSATTIERLEAAVNNHVILRSDLQRFRRTLPLRAQLDPLFNGTPLSQAGTRATDKEILEFLVDEKIILQQFPMTDAEVESEINSIQANNRITREQLRQAIQSQGFRFNEYFDLIRIGAAKRNLIDREIRTKVTVSEDDIRSAYAATYAKGKPAPQAYQVFIITNRDRAKIETAAKALAEGKDFAETAKSLSDDATAENGGELGTLTEDQMNKGIREQLKKMHAGETSGVLGSSKSRYFILRVGAIRAAEDQRLKQVSDQIRAQIASVEYQRQLQLWLERQRQTAFIRRAGDPPAAGLPKGL
jgi:peptidyl-prolyl cis-trans isomerase SurA